MGDEVLATGTADQAAAKVKKGRTETVPRWQIVVQSEATGESHSALSVHPDKYKSPESALRAIEREKIENAIGLFRPLAVASKVTARLV